LCYTVFMKNNDNSSSLTDKDLIIKELLNKLSEKESLILSMDKKISSLDKEKKEIEKSFDLLKLENENNLALIFKMQAKLNELLKDKEIISEKYLIERVKPFISKTEKINEVIINETEEVIKEEKISSKTKGRKKGGKNFANIDFANSFTETIYEDPILDSNLSFDELILASTKERYIVEVIPETIKVIRVIKRSFKDKFNNFYYPLSNEVFPGSILTPSFAAYIAYHKYELGIPFHHLERHLTKTLNFNISKQLLANWMEKTANLLTPLFNKMKDDLLNNQVGVIHSDETTLVVSKRPNHDLDRKKSYVYLYASSYYDKQINIYDFHESRKIDETASWLNDYKGYLVVDDYKGYNKLAKNNPNIKLQKCFAHARRRFVDILKTVPKDKQIGTLSYKILTLINKLFSYEALYKKESLTASEIIKRREKDQRPIIKDLEDLIFNNTYKPNSAIEGAVNYVKSNWNELLTYFESGYLEISNNLAERAIKPFVINRKSFMASGSYAGARYTTKIFSIIRSALINHLDPEKYIAYVLENIKNKSIKELTPYFDKLPKYLKI